MPCSRNKEHGKLAKVGERIGYRYVQLALKANRMIPWLVDSYYGPQCLRAEIERGEVPAAEEVIGACSQMREDLCQEGHESARNEFLSSQIEAIEFHVRAATGKLETYGSELRVCYQATLKDSSFDGLERARSILKRELRASDRTLHAKLNKWENRHRVNKSTLIKTASQICQEAKRRVQAHFAFPEQDSVSIVATSGVHYSGYNRYKGDYKSEITINVEAELTLPRLLLMVCHETYPGHHAFLATREEYLYREQGFEEGMLLLFRTPECVISEGVAQHAARLAFGDEETLLEWSNRALRSRFDCERDARIVRALEQLEIRAQLGRLLFIDHASDQEALQFLHDMALRSDAESVRLLKFVKTYRGYAAAYSAGERLVREALSVGKLALMDMLKQEITPRMLRRHVAENRRRRTGA